MVVRLARETLDFVEARDLVTVPPLAKEVWRLEMMSPERQRVAPFFLGGEVIRVAFPTDEMTHGEKRNEHAREQHPLLPRDRASRAHPRAPPTGVHERAVQRAPGTFPHAVLDGGLGAVLGDASSGTSASRPRPKTASACSSGACTGPRGSIFSLSFHLERMTPGDAVDFLVERVGHEPANAAAEVRRSFNGSYSPLYQAAYMLGGPADQVAARAAGWEGGPHDRNASSTTRSCGGAQCRSRWCARGCWGRLRGPDFEARWRFYGDPP